LSFRIGNTTLDQACAGQYGIDCANDQPNVRNVLQWLELGQPHVVLERCLSDERDTIVKEQFYCPKEGVVDLPVEARMIVGRCAFTKRMHQSFLEFIATESGAAK
jgi:hypothetical protein